jgi:hypothetical protein
LASRFTEDYRASGARPAKGILRRIITLEMGQLNYFQ